MLPEEVVEWVQTGMDPDTKIYMAGEGEDVGLRDLAEHRWPADPAGGSGDSSRYHGAGILSARWATLSILFILILTLISITLVAVSHLHCTEENQ